MGQQKPYMHVSWAIDRVIGFTPNENTYRKWVREGINGIRLEAGPNRELRTNTDCVVRFILRVNKCKPTEEALSLDPEHLPQRAVDLCLEVLGRRVSPSTISGWSKNGYRGVRLQTYSLGRFLLTTRAHVREFAQSLDSKYQARYVKSATADSSGSDSDLTFSQALS